MNNLDFQKTARKALASKATFVAITAPRGLGKTELLKPFIGVEGTTVIDPVEDCSWEHFERMTQHSERVLCTLSTPLRDAKIPDRIKTRIMQGLIVDMHEPEEPERLSICNVMGLTELIAVAVAQNVSKFPRLIGCVKALLFAEPETLEEANAVITNYSDEPIHIVNRRNSTDVFDALIQIVCNGSSVRPDEVTGRRRTRTIANARHMVIYCLSLMTNLTLRELGWYFKGKDPELGLDHSSVLYACNKVRGSAQRKAEAYEVIRTAERLILTGKVGV